MIGAILHNRSMEEAPSSVVRDGGLSVVFMKRRSGPSKRTQRSYCCTRNTAPNGPNLSSFSKPGAKTLSRIVSTTFSGTLMNTQTLISLPRAKIALVSKVKTFLIKLTRS